MEKIFITAGDPNGIGTELILKFISSSKNSSGNAYIIIGCRRIFDQSASVLGYGTDEIKTTSEHDISEIDRPGFYFYDIPSPGLSLQFGKATKKAGLLSGLAINKGVELSVVHGGALVTCPINKYSFHLGGFKFPGHTEFIAELLNTDDFLMILDGGVIRVALVTTHLALKDVSDALSTESIFCKGKLLYRALRYDYGIKKPRISVCSLNPHGSDSGLFGNEEEKIIWPAVESLNAKVAKGIGGFIGPLPSDTLFTKHFIEKTDAYLVMYHDQGLIPLKLLSFGHGVNFTAGLKIIRTSPDHGTAYEIAGKGTAEITSFKNAVEMAEKFVANRRSNLLRS